MYRARSNWTRRKEIKKMSKLIVVIKNELETRLEVTGENLDVGHSEDSSIVITEGAELVFMAPKENVLYIIKEDEDEDE